MGRERDFNDPSAPDSAGELKRDQALRAQGRAGISSRGRTTRVP